MTKVVRYEPKSNRQFSLINEIYVEAGTIADWEAFKRLHYKAEKLPAGARFWRACIGDQVIGVFVLATVTTLLSGRNKLFPNLHPNSDGKDTKLINTDRLTRLNANCLVNSRAVIDPVYRGVGIAYRALNIIYRMTELPIIEFQSSMSKFNPFAGRAGVMFAKPQRSGSYDRGLQLFRSCFESNPVDFVGIRDELASFPEPMCEATMKKMRDFYYKFSPKMKSGNARMTSADRVANMQAGELIRQLQQLIFASPLYGAYKNPDSITVSSKAERQALTSKFPKQVPIIAFDNQATDQPFNFEAMRKIQGRSSCS